MNIKTARLVVGEALFDLTGYLVGRQHWSITIAEIDDGFNVQFCTALSAELGLSPSSITLNTTLEQIAEKVAEASRPGHIFILKVPAMPSMI